MRAGMNAEEKAKAQLPFIYNERLRMRAAFLNNLAVGLIVGGFITTMWYQLPGAIVNMIGATIIGLILHWLARGMLLSLKLETEN
jgi:hypothetical protein